MKEKRRLDQLLVDRLIAQSRSKAAAVIMAGEVRVNDRLIDKPGTMVRLDSTVIVKQKPRYVGRGGLKLEAAIEAFDIDPAGKVCADVGASTGGFTDCLLQHGAAIVYAIDVGSGIMDYRLRVDDRVILLENTNARHLDRLPESPQLVTIDVSFISLRHILPAVTKWIAVGSDIVALVKPQFEAGKGEVGKGGIVRARAVHRRVLNAIVEHAATLGFTPLEILRSPITGAKGNEEYLLWLRLDSDTTATVDFQNQIDSLFATGE